MKHFFHYPSSDGKTQIYAVEWIPETKPFAVLQIAHGVTEYIERYEDFADYLNDRGIVVVGNDHLGHGKSIADDAESMYFGPAGSWNWAVKDIASLQQIMRQKYIDLPYIFLGFSLGSFLVRQFLIDYPKNVSAAIIAGTGQQPSWQLLFAKKIANHEAKKTGEDHTSPRIQKLTFESYNKHFAPNRTKYDWLCGNESSLDEYIKDSMRGEDFSSGLFRELLTGMIYTVNKDNIKNMSLDTPILFISGKDDPVGSFGKGVKKAYDAFKKAGMKQVTMCLKSNMRHDIFHEEKCMEVYEDIYKFIQRELK